MQEPLLRPRRPFARCEERVTRLDDEVERIQRLDQCSDRAWRNRTSASAGSSLGQSSSAACKTASRPDRPRTRMRDRLLRAAAGAPRVSPSVSAPAARSSSSALSNGERASRRGPRASERLDPLRRRLMLLRPFRTGDLRVRDVPHEQVTEDVLGLIADRRLRSRRTNSFRSRECRRSSAPLRSRPPMRSSAPSQNTFPTTDASWRSSFSSTEARLVAPR